MYIHVCCYVHVYIYIHTLTGKRLLVYITHLSTYAYLQEFLRREVKAQNKDELVNGILRFWTTVTAAKCQKYISHLNKVIPEIIRVQDLTDIEHNGYKYLHVYTICTCCLYKWILHYIILYVTNLYCNTYTLLRITVDFPLLEYVVDFHYFFIPSFCIIAPHLPMSIHK